MKVLTIILFIIVIYHINSNSADYNIMNKKGTLRTNQNYLFFESSEFSLNNKMNFKLKSDSYCDEEIKYGYYDSLENIGVNPSVPYTCTMSSEEYETKNGILENTKYFTIKKKEKELNNLNGDYLLLYFGCADEVEISNEKNDNNTLIIVIVVISVLVVLLIIGIIVYYFFFCRKNNDNNNNKI